MPTTFPPSVLLQILYTSGAASILLINSIPALRDRFVQYGKVLSPSSSLSPPPPPPPPSPPPTSKSIFAKLLDSAAALTVPHHFFWHFYAVAVANALFWAYQLASHGSIYRLVASHARSRKEGMRIEQVVLALLCFLAQASRRLYECLCIQPRSASRMWIGHYLVGILFYTLMAIAIWVEGMGTSLLPPTPPPPHD